MSKQVIIPSIELLYLNLAKAYFTKAIYIVMQIESEVWIYTILLFAITVCQRQGSQLNKIWDKSKIEIPTVFE